MVTQLASEHPKTRQLGPVSVQWEGSGIQKDSGVREGSREMIELKEESGHLTTEEAKKTWSWKGDLYSQTLKSQFSNEIKADKVSSTERLEG